MGSTLPIRQLGVVTSNKFSGSRVRNTRVKKRVRESERAWGKIWHVERAQMSLFMKRACNAHFLCFLRFAQNDTKISCCVKCSVPWQKRTLIFIVERCSFAWEFVKAIIIMVAEYCRLRAENDGVFLIPVYRDNTSCGKIL